MSSNRRSSGSALSSFLEHSSFTASTPSSSHSSSSRTVGRSSSASKGSPLVAKEKKGKEKGREQEEQRGGTRLEVDIIFPRDHSSKSGKEARVQMLGGLGTSSAYSLPLEVLINVLPPASSSSSSSSSHSHSSFWNSKTSSRNSSGCIVRAVEITYEVRTEFFDFTCYSSLRIHHQTHRIVLPTPLFIPLASSSSSSQPSSHAIPLDVLRLPGWLPPTFYLPFATLTSSVSATVEVVNLPSSSGSGSGWLGGRGGGGGATEGKTRFSSSGEREVMVERLRVPKALCPMEVRDRDLVDPSGFSMRHFSLKAEAESPIDCVISVSEFLPFDSPSFEFSIRVRSRPGWLESGGGALSLVALEFAVEQVEKYRSTPSGTFASTYPIPDEQPLTGHPLRQQSSLHALSDLGVFPAAPHKSTRVTSLFRAEGGGARTIVFEGEEGELTGKMWKKLDLRAEKPRYVVGKNGVSRKGERRVIPAMATPFLKVGHGLKIRILCRNENSPSDTVILLNSPLRFVATPGTIPPPSSSPSQSSSSPTRQPRIPLPSSAHILPPSSLPPYVTLFFESGTAREDPEPLPLYGSVDEPPRSPPPPISPISVDFSSSDADPSATVDPVVAMLEEREIQERVHGVRRGGGASLGRDDLDSEEIEELDDFVEVGGSTSTRTRDRDRRRPPLGRPGSSSRNNSGDTLSLSTGGRPSFSSSIRPGTPPPIETPSNSSATDDLHPPHPHPHPHPQPNRLSSSSWRPPNRLPPSRSSSTSTSPPPPPFLHRSSSLGIMHIPISIPISHSSSSASSIANLSPASSHSILPPESTLPSSPKLPPAPLTPTLPPHTNTQTLQTHRYTHTHTHARKTSENHPRGRTSTIASRPPSSFSSRSFDGLGGGGGSTRAPSRDSSADGSEVGLCYGKREVQEGGLDGEREEEVDGRRRRE